MILLGALTCFASNSGAALNPARDFGPRIFCLIAGYGWDNLFESYHYFFFIPIIGPILGGIIGSYSHKFISHHLN